MQQLQTGTPQLQTPQYTNYAGNPYTMAPQQGLPRNAAHPSQQPQAVSPNALPNVQSHAMAMGPGIATQGIAPPPEPTNPYTREFGAWGNAYYGYQSAQTQQGDGQWGGVRGSGVYR